MNAITEPYVVLDMPNEEYHAHPAVGKSKLDALSRSPAHYYAEHLWPERPPREESDAFRIGSAVDCAVFEPTRFAYTYVRAPGDAPRRPTSVQLNAKKPSPDTVAAIEFWRAFDSENAGKIVLTHQEFRQCCDMAASVAAHAGAAHILSKGGNAQQSIFVPSKGLPGLKARPDFAWNDYRVLSDLKTTVDARPAEFARSVAKFRYHVQAALYTDVVEMALNRRPEAFLFIVVEKNPPYAVCVYRLDSDSIELGRQEYQRNLVTLRECMERQEWPAYPEEIMELSLPTWFTRQQQSAIA